MNPVAAKVPDEVYDKILYEAARRGVTVSRIVRDVLEDAFGEREGNRKETAQEGRS